MFFVFFSYNTMPQIVHIYVKFSRLGDIDMCNTPNYSMSNALLKLTKAKVIACAFNSIITIVTHK